MHYKILHDIFARHPNFGLFDLQKLAIGILSPTLQKWYRISPLYLRYVAVTFLYRRDFSLTVEQGTKGFKLEIILISCDTKPPFKDMNRQPLDPCSGTLANIPKTYSRSIIMNKWYPMAH
jgi:hypothetical protein